MNNKKIPTCLGTAILIIIAITAGAFVWVYEKGQNLDTAGITTVWPKTIQKEAAGYDGQKKSDFRTTTIDPIENWKTYQDKEYEFKFEYPTIFDVKVTDYYSISNSSGELVNFTVKNWKNHVIQEGTPGTFWEKISYENWKYFADNYEKISSGECNKETITRVPGSTAADAPKICIVNKQNGYIKVETEDHVIYFTKDLEIRWQFNEDDADTAKKIASTFRID